MKKNYKDLLKIINNLNLKINKTGGEKKKEIETIYKNHSTTAGETTKGGYDAHNQLDTIEDNLAAIEKKNSNENTWI